MKSTESKFIKDNDYQIDDPIFFSDVGLSDLDVVNNYKQLLSESKYTEASKLLNESDVGFFGAWIFNLLENRLKAIEDFYEDGEREKPDLVSHSNDEPQGKSKGYCWVADIDIE